MSETSELAAILTAVIRLLAQGGEAAWATRLQGILDRLLEGGSATSQQAAIREILVLYQQGMGGLQDVVLQNTSGVLPEQGTQAEHRRARGPAGGRPVSYDRTAYRGRNVIERALNGFKHWRGLATRYDKHAIIYRGGLILAAALTWLANLGDTS
jgi:hypothetical protein